MDLRCVQQVKYLDSQDFTEKHSLKAQEATQTKLPLEGTVLITVNDKDKDEVVDLARDFADTGFKILASKHTGKLIQDAGIEVEIVNKLQEGRPNILT